jgi:hypothetical protein
MNRVLAPTCVSQLRRFYFFYSIYARARSAICAHGLIRCPAIMTTRLKCARRVNAIP